MSESIKAIVDGGKASAGPPLGPALGPMGVNTGEVINQINEKTKNFKGMKIPIEVIVDAATKEFEVKVGSPPTSALLLKALGSQKGGGNENAGDMKIQDLLQVAKDKQDSLLAKDLKAALKEVAGTCQSLKLTIEGRPPKIFMQEVDKGVLDKIISGEETEMPEMTQAEKDKISALKQEAEAKQAREAAKEAEKAAEAVEESAEEGEAGEEAAPESGGEQEKK